MLQLVSLWGQMSVKSVTADHADPSHNHGRADPVATLSLGTCSWCWCGGDKSRQTQPCTTTVSKNTPVLVQQHCTSHRDRTLRRGHNSRHGLQVPLKGRVTYTPHERRVQSTLDSLCETCTSSHMLLNKPVVSSFSCFLNALIPNRFTTSTGVCPILCCIGLLQCLSHWQERAKCSCTHHRARI